MTEPTSLVDEPFLRGHEEAVLDHLLPQNKRDEFVAFSALRRQWLSQGGKLFELCKIAHHWLDGCEAGHEHCHGAFRSSPPPQLPCRLILLDNLDSGNLKIIRTCDIDIGERAVRYCALSYRWPEDTLACTVLTSENEAEYTQGFQLATLASGLQDACRVAKLIGFQYMWIDALCIQQGRGGDWHAEAQAMDTIYTNAAVTIALVDGTGLDELARVRETPFISDPQALGRMLSDISRQTDPDLGTSSLSQEELYRALSATGNFVSRPSGVLDSRAWAFQERLLSRRIIGVTREGLFWDCLHHSACDRRPLGIQGDHSPDFRDSDDRKVKRLLLDTPQPLLVGSGVGPHASPSASRSELLWHWRRILQQYTKRSLTYQTDRLLAVDGVMRRMGQILSDENVLGICRTDAVRCLLWFEEPRFDVLGRLLSNEPVVPDSSLQRAGKSHAGHRHRLETENGVFSMPDFPRAKTMVAAITDWLSLHSRSQSTVTLPSIDTDAISRQLIAPSWSWAGVANPIQYRLWHPHNRNQDSLGEIFTKLAVVESMHAQRSDDRLFGSYEGLLVLKGHSVNCFIHDSSVYAYHSWHIERDEDPVNLEELMAELGHDDSYAQDTGRVLDTEQVVKNLQYARALQQHVANLGSKEDFNWGCFIGWFNSRISRNGSIAESTPLLADDVEGYLEKRRAHQREHETRCRQRESWPQKRQSVDRMATCRFEFLHDHFEGGLAEDVVCKLGDGLMESSRSNNNHKYEMARLLVLGRGGYDGVHMGQYCLVLRQVGLRWKRIGICVYDAQQCCLQDPRLCQRCIPTGVIKPCLGHWDRFEIE